MFVFFPVLKVLIKITPSDRTIIEGDTVSIKCVGDPPPDKYILSFSLVSQKQKIKYINTKFFHCMSLITLLTPQHNFDLLLPTESIRNGKSGWKVHNSEYYSTRQISNLSARQESFRTKLKKSQCTCTNHCRL